MARNRSIGRRRDARAYLTSFCWEDGPYCPRCRESTVYHLKDGRMRCSACAYTFHDFTSRWINQVRLSPRSWLRLLDMFALGANSSEIAGELEISYNTAHKALGVVRLAVACLSGEGERLIACRDRLTGFCAVHKRTAGEEKILRCLAPVFGVRLSRNGATLELLEDMRAHEAVKLPTLKKIWREVFYTDHCLGFDGLLFSCCRRFRENRYLPLADSPVSLDSREGFWSFARRQLENYHCLSPENFPLYLKEQEFRYAHRQGDLVSALLAALCAFVPNLWH